MQSNITPEQVSQIEQAISRIGAQVADGVALSQRAKEPALRAELTLIQAQQGLEGLYLSLGPEGAE